MKETVESIKEILNERELTECFFVGMTAAAVESVLHVSLEGLAAMLQAMKEEDPKGFRMLCAVVSVLGQDLNNELKQAEEDGSEEN